MSPQDNKQEMKVDGWVGNPADLSSFNAYGVVTLSDGQTVNVQLTGRHGIFADERLYEDFKKFVAFLDKCAIDSAVKFWDGKKSERVETTVHSGKAEPHYEYPENQSGAEKVVVEYKSGKPFYSVTGVKGTKYPVRVWPEVLTAAGIVPESVDPKDGLSLAGWTVTFEKKDKFPSKIVGMEKPGFAE
jgi:hypothetical protein